MRKTGFSKGFVTSKYAPLGSPSLHCPPHTHTPLTIPTQQYELTLPSISFHQFLILIQGNPRAASSLACIYLMGISLRAC